MFVVGTAMTGIIERLLGTRRLEIFIAGMTFFFGCWLLMPAVSMRTAAYGSLHRGWRAHG